MIPNWNYVAFLCAAAANELAMAKIAGTRLPYLWVFGSRVEAAAVSARRRRAHRAASWMAKAAAIVCGCSPTGGAR
jgi:hypothetical protein